MKLLLGKCFIIVLLVMVSAVGYHCGSSHSVAVSSFFALDPPVFLHSYASAPQFTDVHHPKITAGKNLLLNVEKPTAATGQTITPLRQIFSFTLLKELLLRQIHRKLLIINILHDYHFAKKILYGCFTLGMEVMRC